MAEMLTPGLRQMGGHFVVLVGGGALYQDIWALGL
jgi:hypothetical protein